MEKLTMCRICLAEDVRMQLVRATHLHKMYEALTSMPFETEDSRPLQVCYICCARLQNCYKFKMRCLQSEELFSQMLNKKVKLTGGLSKQELSTVQVVQMSFDDVVQSPTLRNEVKVEYEHPEATTGDIVEDAGSYEHFQFSNIEEQETIDIMKHEPDEQTKMSKSRAEYMRIYRQKKREEKLKTGNVVPKKIAKSSTQRTREFRARAANSILSQTSTAAPTIALPNRDVSYTLSTSAATASNTSFTEIHPHPTNVDQERVVGEDVQQMEYIKLTGGLSKQELSTVQVVQMSFDDVVQSPKLCYEVKVEYEHPEATTSDIVEDAGRDEHLQFSDIEEQEMIDIVKHEPDEPTSAPVHTQSALTTQANETLSNFKKCENSEILIEELKTDTEIALKDNILQTHNERDHDHDHKKGDLVKHIRKHTGEKPYRCNLCKKCFGQKGTLVTHIRTHTGEKPYQCIVCKKCFGQKSDLVRHIRTHNGEKLHQCHICKKRFTHKGYMEKHIRIHTGETPYQCEVCKKCFIEKGKLLEHIRTHTGEKPFECNVCNKRFSQKRYLENHIRVHTGKKPYQCNLCNKYFSRKEHVDLHIRTHTGEKPYQCNICKKYFSRKNDLVTHIGTHTSEKPYQCNVCKKLFSQKRYLENHIRVHTGEKPYQCYVCQKCFSRKEHLDLHIRTHTGERPYQCNVCKKCFSLKGNLDTHIRTHR